jgi:2-polyprenyl-3-methyl-5-hydroxy-6-metoxy-1,4-benzoquinol methylase
VPEGGEYAEDYYAMSRSGEGAKAKVDTIRDRFIRRQVLRRVPGGRLLDVGCGLGLFLETMRPEFAPYGVDISDYAVTACAARLPGARVRVSSLLDGLPDDEEFAGDFDVITAINIIEHLEDPWAAVAAVRARLRVGGLFVMHLPTIGNAVQARMYAGSYDQDPTHIYRPSGKAVSAMVEASGFAQEFGTFAPFVGAPLWRLLPWHPAFLGIYRAI